MMADKSTILVTECEGDAVLNISHQEQVYK